MNSSSKYPDSAICETRHFYGNVYKCLAGEENCLACPHAREFGFVYFCEHPKGIQFCKPHASGSEG
jgi:hypothetical protein